jgi:hypothetical protein
LTDNRPSGCVEGASAAATGYASRGEATRFAL